MSTEHDNRHVSDAYREIATETTPAKLDDSILAMAKQEARTRYGFARAWIRPAAWAATIALSFAFILEMTYFAEQPAPIDAAAPARIESDADTPADDAEPAFKRAPSAAVIAAPEIKASELPTLREAEERVDEAAARYADKAQASRIRAEVTAFDSATDIDRCEAEARQSADTWYLCVLALREQGLDDAAAAELLELREAFPDFREPVRE